LRGKRGSKCPVVSRQERKKKKPLPLLITPKRKGRGRKERKKIHEPIECRFGRR